MKFRVWCAEIDHWSRAPAIEARSDQDAAHDYMDNLDASGMAFPEDNDGDKCTIQVREWEETNEDREEPPSRTFVFKLVKERRVELK